MCENPGNTWERDHRRLVQLAAKDDPTERDVMEAKDIISRTQFDASVRTNQLELDYDAMYARYDWTAVQSGPHIQDWQGVANDLNWAILHILQSVQTVAMTCGDLAKKAGKRGEAREARVNTRKTSPESGSAWAKVGANPGDANNECSSVQAKAGEEPRDKDNSWGFLLDW